MRELISVMIELGFLQSNCLQMLQTMQETSTMDGWAWLWGIRCRRPRSSSLNTKDYHRKVERGAEAPLLKMSTDQIMRGTLQGSYWLGNSTTHHRTINIQTISRQRWVLFHQSEPLIKLPYKMVMEAQLRVTGMHRTWLAYRSGRLPPKWKYWKSQSIIPESWQMLLFSLSMLRLKYLNSSLEV